MRVDPGATNVTTYFTIRTAADGTATTGGTITDIDLQYVRSGAAPSAKVDATALAATDSAHADNKAIEIDGTDQPGLYRVDWPDAAFAAGVREVILTVKLASSFTEHLRVELEGAGTAEQARANAALVANNLDHLCLTATAAADMTTEVADNTIISRIIGNGDTSTFVPSTDGLHAAGVDLDAILADTNELQSDWTDTGRLDTILDSILNDTDLIDDGTSGLAKIATDVAAILLDTAVIGAAGAGLTAVGLADASIKNATFNADMINGTVAYDDSNFAQAVAVALLEFKLNQLITAASDGVVHDTSVIGRMTGGDDFSAYDGSRDCLTAIRAAITAMIGADSDTLETLSDQIDSVEAAGGSGSNTVTITVDDGTDPLEGAQVWVRTGSEDTGSITASGVTDTNGEVTVYLDDGTFYVWKQLAGYNFDNPETMVVAG